MTDIVDLLGEFETLRVIRKDPTIYSEVGLKNISKYIVKTYGVELPVGFVPYINTNSGKIATRVERYVKAATGKGISNKDKQEIGNIANRHVSNVSNIYFDIHDGVMDWKKGNFGNNNSCWRASWRASTPMFREGDGYGEGFVLRIYATKPHTRDIVENDYRFQGNAKEKRGFGVYYGGLYGYGRIWLMPWKDNSLLALNPYGETYEWYVELLMQVIGENYKGTVHQKHVKFENSTDGIYSNNGNIGIFTLDKEYPKGSVYTRLTPYVTIQCQICRQYFSRERSIHRKTVNNFCDECGIVCAVFGTIHNADRMIRLSVDTYVDYNGEKHVIKAGQYVSPDFESQVGFCDRCLETHRYDEECEHEVTS